MLKTAHTQKELMEVANIGDQAKCSVCGTVFNGTVTMISKRGVNINSSDGTIFVKWCNVKEIHKAKGR